MENAHVNDNQSVSSSPSYLGILLVCSSPIGSNVQLNVHQEVLALEHAIRQSALPIWLRHLVPPTFSELERALVAQRTWEPAVLHFIGHGEEDGVWFEDVYGRATLVSPSMLSAALQGSSVELVVLNACHTAGKQILGICDVLTRSGSVATAIGHREPIRDDSANKFAETFYRKLLANQTVQTACSEAAESIFEQDQAGHWNTYLAGRRDLVLGTGLMHTSTPLLIEDRMLRRGYVPPSRNFFGRYRELLEGAQVLDDPEITVLGIYGIGGLGKTALALELAHRNAWRFEEGGVAFVDIRDLPASKRTADGLIHRCLTLLTGRANAPDPVTDLLHGLSEFPGLLVLDNLEDLASEEHDALFRYLQRLPRNGSSVILTARNRLPNVGNLRFARVITLASGLDLEDGTCYAQRIANIKGVKAIVSGEGYGMTSDELCHRIAEAVAGHPRMIEVAVGLAATDSSHLLTSLAGLTGELGARHDQLVQTGLDLLDDRAMRLLAYLQVFPVGSFLRDEMKAAVQGVRAVVHQILSGAESEPADSDTHAKTAAEVDWVDSALETLGTAGFLDSDTGSGLFSFHPSLLSYSQRVDRLDVERLSKARYGCLFFYWRYFSRTYPDLQPGGSTPYSDDVSHIDLCADRALDCLEKTYESLPEVAETGKSLWTKLLSTRKSSWTKLLESIIVSCVNHMTYYFITRGVWLDGIRWCERSLEFLSNAHKKSDKQKRAATLFELGTLCTLVEDFQRARPVLEESATLFRKLDHRQGYYAALFELSKVLRTEGKVEEAHDYLVQCLEAARTNNDHATRVAVFHEMAVVEEEQQELDTAKRHIHEAIALGKATGRMHEVAKSLTLLGQIFEQEGAFLDARSILRDALALIEAGGWTTLESAACSILSRVEFHLDSSVEARRLIHRAINIDSDLGQHVSVADRLATLAEFDFNQGNFEAARRSWQDAIQLLEAFGDRDATQDFLIDLARIERDQGNFEEAGKYLKQYVEIARAGGDERVLAIGLHQLGGIELSQGRLPKARTLYLQAVEYKDRQGDVRELAATLHQLAIVEMLEGNDDEAERLWKRVLKMFQGIHDVEGMVKVSGMLAQIYLRQGKHDQALNLAKTAVQDLERAGSKDASLMRKMRETLDMVDRAANQGQADTGGPSGAADGESRASSLLEQGRALVKAGDIAAGVELLRRARVAAQDEDDPGNEILVLAEVCNGLLAQGGSSFEALEYMKEGATLARTLGDSEAERWFERLAEHGRLEAKREEVLNRSLTAELAEVDDDLQRAGVCYNRANALLSRSPAEAQELADLGLRYAQSTDSVELESLLYWVRSMATAAKSELGDARENIEAALELCKGADLPEEAMKGMQELAAQLDQHRDREET